MSSFRFQNMLRQVRAFPSARAGWAPLRKRPALALRYNNPARQKDRAVRPFPAQFSDTGRQLLRRPGYEVDIEEILAPARPHGVAVKINANPWWLDLDWRWHERALERGCMMSINPDAHSTDEIDHTHWGVEMARKGGVPKERC